MEPSAQKVYYSGANESFNQLTDQQAEVLASLAVLEYYAKKEDKSLNWDVEEFLAVNTSTELPKTVDELFQLLSSLEEKGVVEHKEVDSLIHTLYKWSLSDTGRHLLASSLPQFSTGAVYDLY